MVAAQAEAERMVGDLFERERAERAIHTRKRHAQMALDDANEKARRAAMSPVERRKVRRAELYQRHKRARFMVIGG